MKLNVVLTVLVAVVLVAAPAHALKVIGRKGAADPPKPEPAKKAAPPTPVKATKAPKAAKVGDPKPAAAPGEDVAPLTAGGACELLKQLKVKVGKDKMTLNQGSKVTVKELGKSDVVLTTVLGEVRVKRKELAPICKAAALPEPALVPVASAPADLQVRGVVPQVSAALPPPPPPEFAPKPAEPPAKATATVSFAVEPMGARVMLDAKLVGTAPVGAIEISRGSHTLSAELDGYAAASRNFDVNEGELTTIALTLRPVQRSGSSSSSGPPSMVGRNLGIVFTTLGVLGIGGGVAFFVLGRSQASTLAGQATTYNAEPIRLNAEYGQLSQGVKQVQLFDTLMYVSAGIGVAAAITGVALLVVNSKASDARTRTEVSLVPGLGGMGLVGSF